MAISVELEQLITDWLHRQPWRPRAAEDDVVPSWDLNPMSTVTLFQREIDDDSRSITAARSASTLRIRGLIAVLGVGEDDARHRISLPLTLRTREAPPLRPALLGEIDDLLLGRCYVYDGTADPELLATVLATIEAGEDAGQMTGVRQPPANGISGPGEESAADDPGSDEHEGGEPAVSGEHGGHDEAAGFGDHAGVEGPAGIEEPADSGGPEQSDASAAGAAGSASDGHGTGDRAAAVAPPSRALRHLGFDEVEQLGGHHENSLVAIRREGGEEPVLLKFFRRIDDAPEPSVQLASALTSLGSGAVPPVRGWLSGTWYDTEEMRERSAEIAVLSRYVGGEGDAWQEAVDSAAAFPDEEPEPSRRAEREQRSAFAPRAEDLGRAVAALHAELDREFGTVSLTRDQTESTIDAWRRRVDWALARVPVALAPLSGLLRSHARSLAFLELGRLQRIHGDLTLASALCDDGELALVGFASGEVEPQLPAEDIAQLLLSIDQAAGVARMDREGPLGGNRTATALGLIGQHELDELVRRVASTSEYAWSQQVREAVLAGYSAGMDRPLHAGDPLLRAVLVDRLLVQIVSDLHRRSLNLEVPLVALALLLDPTRALPAADAEDEADPEHGAAPAADAEDEADPEHDAAPTSDASPEDGAADEHDRAQADGDEANASGHGEAQENGDAQEAGDPPGTEADPSRKLQKRPRLRKSGKRGRHAAPGADGGADSSQKPAETGG